MKSLAILCKSDEQSHPRLHYELGHDPRRAQLHAGHHPSSGALGKVESVRTLAALLEEMEQANSSYWQLRDAVRTSS